MIEDFSNKERKRMYVALVRAQGEISDQLAGVNGPPPLDRKKLTEEHMDLEKIAKKINETFKNNCM